MKEIRRISRKEAVRLSLGLKDFSHAECECGWQYFDYYKDCPKCGSSNIYMVELSELETVKPPRMELL